MNENDHEDILTTKKKKVLLKLLTKEGSLNNKQRPPEKAITKHSTVISRSWGPKPKWMHMHHKLCIYGSENIAKRKSRKKISKRQDVQHEIISSTH